MIFGLGVFFLLQKTACVNDGFSCFSDRRKILGKSNDIGILFLILQQSFKMHNQYLKRIYDENTTFLYTMD